MEWIIFAVMAAFGFSFSDFFKKKILNKEHAFQFLSIFNLIFLALLCIALFFVGTESLKVPPPVLGAIFFRTLVGVIGFILYIKSLRHLEISTVAPLINFRAIFALILGVIFLGESILGYQVAGVLIIVFGAYVIDSGGHIKNWHKPLADLMHSKYIQFALYFAFFLSITAILAKKILIYVSPFTLLFYSSVFLNIFYLSITFFVYKGFKDIKLGWQIGKKFLLIAVILELAGAYFKFSAYAQPGAKIILIVPLLQVSTLVSIFLGGRLLKEKHIGLKLGAAVLMIAGIILLVI